MIKSRRDGKKVFIYLTHHPVGVYNEWNGIQLHFTKQFFMLLLVND